MKPKIKNLMLIAILFIACNSFGQDIKDSNGAVIAKLNATTDALTNSINQFLGQFSDNGEVKNAIGDVIGMISGNDFKDATGLVLGSISTNHNVKDMNGHSIGIIQGGTTIMDANQDVIGTTSAPIDNKILAAYFFFFYDNDM